ncbi:methyltransferase [Pseudarthrobacter sp. NIBRBAC000502772]|uniref:SAM-dependent methyltransferase n=1 Tax=Pseudarthrobacter sp. NIBRBAC000502772 TaxID=2590775 RepID=UPI00113278E7|nr:methyltransferase [Pseudarthrobacter sp. NIBRBAC000502772]QDG66960.1 methyltransferase [Pseudarthrobacter sp. NIBRBAC000502772]
MTDPNTPPARGGASVLRTNSPIGRQSFDRLINDLATNRPRTVLDHGCGWGGMLMDILEAMPNTSGTGIDINESYIDQARMAAEQRGLADRALFQAESSADCAESADLVLNVGSYQAFGTISEALSRLRSSTTPFGRLVFGAEIWSVVPTDNQLAHMWPGTTVDDALLLPDLVDKVISAGWRVLDLRTSTSQEWEEFECGHLRNREQWLVTHPEHEAASEIRDELDKARMMWLRGHRDVMGFVTFVLAKDG